MKPKLPYIKSPCKDCPFRKDSVQGWLGEKRMTEILESQSFVCHKKTSSQCAGHMIIKKDDNGFVSLAKRCGIDLELKGQELVFDTEQDCINHHK